MKKCFKCHREKPLSEYYKHKQTADGHLNKCKDCTKKDVRRRYHDPETKPRIVEYDRLRQRDHLGRIFRHRYSSMKTRIEGRAIREYASQGREIATLEEFLVWCHSEPQASRFAKLHADWKREGYPRGLTPSIDRIDNSGGYTLDNIRWITVRDNNRKWVN